MSAAPGWYPDNAGTIRYWDGAQWTEHTQPAPVATQQYQEQPVATEYAQPAAVVQPEVPVQLQDSGQKDAQVEQFAAPVVQAQPTYAQPQYQQAGYQQYGYQLQIVGTGESNGLAISGFIVGLVSIFLPLFIGLGVGIAGLVLSIVGLSKSKVTGTGKGLAITGIVLSSVGIAFLL